MSQELVCLALKTCLEAPSSRNIQENRILNHWIGHKMLLEQIQPSQIPIPLEQHV
jgi:hypothetical protein